MDRRIEELEKKIEYLIQENEILKKDLNQFAVNSGLVQFFTTYSCYREIKNIHKKHIQFLNYQPNWENEFQNKS